MEVAGGTSSTGLRLPPLKGLEPAHSLDMGGLRLGPLSAEVIGKLISTYRPDMPALRVDNNPILADGMKALAEALKHNDDIRELHMRYCGIGPLGVQALTQALKLNSTLEYVSIIGNQIGDEGAEALIACVPQSNLKQLEVQDNLIAPQLKEKLEAACAKKAGLKVFV